jgi:hypothetical protein
VHVQSTTCPYNADLYDTAIQDKQRHRWSACYLGTVTVISTITRSQLRAPQKIYYGRAAAMTPFVHLNTGF